MSTVYYAAMKKRRCFIAENDIFSRSYYTPDTHFLRSSARVVVYVTGSKENAQEPDTILHGHVVNMFGSEIFGQLHV